MGTTTYLANYASLGLLLVLGALVFVAAFTANRLLRTTVSTPEKESTYECGLDPVGEGWAQMQIRYYVYAFLYALFAVESVFLFPWAIVFDRPGFGLVTVAEMGVFIAVLALGLAYAWRKGVLTWA
ncbi:NADH-quinone oxidoreductase subunit A [Stackebrandtia nassauensis]|uniref:NADH-quinone oxidoreductase subunit A n=1 Tax=Stackebrandtia nassauensis (strain DSM 44728 / CIP 108903 / NRRL B-16338 / NBRC 102104 / LLR-40K-21) TaxID=446470 RepID=D3Q066_STANL|nr:NADH-quinone oxidoreductase subunit A [Stackebrandtia nassauensis]ADD45595.1 NADH-ubiquinone/plastoquinone oxidoreductase chain 3 [Stackebrandtia nassauensis DSM 44728]